MIKLPSEMIGDQSGESVGWCRWWMFAVISWILLFIAGFIALFRAWQLAGQGAIEGIADEILFFSIPVACVVISSLLAGFYALVNGEIRRQLLSLPTAAALACLSLSFVVASLSLFGYSIADLGYQQFVEGSARDGGMTLELIKGGFAVGVMAFPLTFGLAFPLGMPLGAAIFLRLTIKARGSISPLSWSAALGFSIFGWWLVVVVGIALGMGG